MTMYEKVQKLVIHYVDRGEYEHAYYLGFILEALAAEEAKKYKEGADDNTGFKRWVDELLARITAEWYLGNLKSVEQQAAAQSGDV